MRILIHSFIVLALGVCGCKGKGDSKEAIAKVNNRSITVGAFETKLGRIAHLPGKDLSNIDQKKALLNEMINEELLYQAALKEGIIDNSERLRREVAREYLNSRMGKERYEPTEDEIKDYYDKKKDELERVRVSHILIKPDKPGDPASEKAALAKTEALLAKIRKEGDKADFAKYARENSQDEATKVRGGDLFFFDRKKMVPEFSAAAFGLQKVGDVSPIVKTQYGYHIVKLMGEQRGLDFFRHSIKWQIAQEKQKGKSDDLFETLRDKASVKIYENMLAKVTVPSSSHPPVPGGQMQPPAGSSNPAAPGTPGQ